MRSRSLLRRSRLRAALALSVLAAVSCSRSSEEAAGRETVAEPAYVGRRVCAGCHQAAGHGHQIGPSLAAMKTRGPETILVNVLDPNREVNPQYLNYVVLTDDGRTLSGMIMSENATSVTLGRADAATDTVQRTDIQQLKSTGLSIMPEGLEESVDPQALADIIEYLMKVQ